MSTTLKRSLSARHLTMIALGGSIGTGLFVASGAVLSQAGPAGAIAAYALIGLMVYFLMTGLGELAAYEPVSGSFATYGEKYVDEGFGFALGINYWYNWAIAIAVDLVAAQLVMAWWFPQVPGWCWSAIFLSVIFAFNWASARIFGEAEFWFAFVKVAAVVFFIIAGTLLLLGVPTEVEGSGFANWTAGEGPFAGGFAAFFAVAMTVGYSFQGTELIGVAAGESKDPQKNIPKAVKQIFRRILLFYILSTVVMSLLIPYTDPRLLKNDLADVAVSPFTLVFENAGLVSAASVMNAVILTTVLSAGNSGMYAATRMLHTLALAGKMPKIFGRTSASGVPRNALLATTVISCLCFLTAFYGDQTVYFWLLNTTGMGGFICWLGMAISHYRFRRGYVAQGGRIEDLPYRAPFFPVGPAIAFAICAFIAAGQNYEALFDVFTGTAFDGRGLLATYVGLLIFAALWIGYRVTHPKVRIVRFNEMRFPDIEARKTAEKIAEKSEVAPAEAGTVKTTV